MSKSSSRARRAAGPLRVSPLISQYVPALRAAAPVSTPAVAALPVRNVLISKSLFGVTVNRYRDGYEILYADGRKIAARSPWGLFAQMFKGGAK
ncbi:hypothetical protein [Burkholderia ubonensis]|uniref:hypothetical protein n=1 Tax=Burkholderia ubonensis TaxID=101571 RepID=UPI00076BE7F8|nr:hypothetical protein [Burkholderia ubonensis]KVP16806.1 hypothetical protein WJ84_00605 [Burkholderia ubonensis]